MKRNEFITGNTLNTILSILGEGAALGDIARCVPDNACDAADAVD